MGSLTRCNRCKLNSMLHRARARGVEVIVEVVTAPDDPMRGWTSARYSDADEPTAWFVELSDGCAC